MANFVLVHGAFSGAWIWGPLEERLRAAGHTAVAFDLPGSGDDRTPSTQVTLDLCAALACEVLAATGGPALLVGHSMGGVIITQAAARCPQSIAALVYVSAFIPKNGQSLLELTNLPEGAGDQVQANLMVNEQTAEGTMPPEASRDALYACCTEETATWAIAHQRPQPLAPFVTPVSIPPGALVGIKKFYVACARDRAVPPPLQHRMIADNGCAGVFDLDTDHTPQLSRTEGLASAMLQIAAALP
ncbi:MAG: alpha/beta fold hydrolase [Candidatus Acidiferrales bacterium]